MRGLDICIHGHTHRWRDEVAANVHFINVSTATGAWFGGDRSAGILTLNNGTASLERVDMRATVAG